ncbi:MAG: PD40 domain-containing protein [Bacteroidetes bacterium]|jgi:tetratricopeptide (TPR) repeat protein|nr:PD40 domain-containing protein [Bacteroidota bacterium]
MKRTKLFFIHLILFLSLGLNAQTIDKATEKNLEKGKQLYSEGKYAKVIEILKPLADSGQKSAVRRVADSYRFLSDPVNAEPYYAKVMLENNPPSIYFLHYGWALLQNKKYDLAKEMFQKFSVASPDDKRGKEMLIACEKAKEMELNIKNPNSNSNVNRLIYFPKETPEIENINYNSEFDDFGPVFYQNGLVFTSSRSEGIQFFRKKDQVTGASYLNVFYNADTSKNEIDRIKGGINLLNFNSGPICFDSAQNKIYFTRNNVVPGEVGTSKKGEVLLKIFEAEKEGNAFKNIKELEFNGEEYSCAYPTISQNGKRIYYTSDRSGGKGGKDLYMSEFKKGKWSKPINLDIAINSSGNERFPFIHPDGTLFFSSDGWGGLGGLDIYKASPLPGDTTGTKFEKPINLGKAYNSSRDDFSFIANDNYTEGYFASNKEGSKGGDDIYHLIWENNLLNLNFINEKDSSIVPNFRFLLKSENSNYLSISKKSNNLGQIQLKANPNTNYKMESLDEKWTIQNTNLSTGKNGNTTEITIKLIEKVIPLIEPNTIKP